MEEGEEIESGRKDGERERQGKRTEGMNGRREGEKGGSVGGRHIQGEPARWIRQNRLSSCGECTFS